MGFVNFFKKIAPWMSTGVQFIPGAGPVVAATITRIANDAGAPAANIKPDIDSLSNAVASLTGNADAMLRLKQADQDFQKQMQQIGFQELEDMEKLADADRANARQMQMQTRSWLAPTLALVISGGFLALLFFMAVGKFRAADDQALLLLLGGLNTSFAAVVSYYFGSSAGSNRKTELMANGNGNGNVKK